MRSSAPSGTCRSETCESSLSDLWRESWEIHALGSDQRDEFICPSHVSRHHSGHRPHPAFRIRRPAHRSRPDDGFPIYGKAIALIYMCIPGLGICFSLRRYAATSVARYIATRLHAYRTTRRRPAKRGKGRPWVLSGHAPIFLREVPSGPPEALPLAIAS